MASASWEDRPGDEEALSEPPPAYGSSEFEATFGEPLKRALDLSTWLPSERLGDLYARLEQEVRAAASQTERARKFIREELFPRFAEDASEAPNGGLRQATTEQIERVHRGLLFTGQVEACDGTSMVHDTLALTIAQIGVCLVSYQGDAGSWAHRLYHRDLRVAPADTAAEVMALLESRRRRGGGETTDAASRRDLVSDLGRRGIMSYIERAVLADEAKAPWRMGHGSAIPYELLTGSGNRELLELGLDVLERLLLKHRRFVYVPSAPDRWLRTIGDALDPLEYAIVDTLRRTSERIVDRGHYGGAWSGAHERARSFAREAGSQVVVGIFRASSHAPAQVFYAHKDHADEAALIVLADASLQAHRGFPTLIDLADRVCSATFDGGGFMASAQLAYAETGLPYRHLRERETRYG